MRLRYELSPCSIPAPPLGELQRMTQVGKGDGTTAQGLVNSAAAPHVSEVEHSQPRVRPLSSGHHVSLAAVSRVNTALG